MRLPILFIFITVTIDAMGIGLILPVMPDLIGEVSGGTLADAAWWGGVLSASYAAMQFLCAPALGNLSDRFGRRPVLLIGMAVLAADYVVMSVAGTIWLLLIGRIVAGIAAGTHTTALAFMADISKPEERAANFGLISAGFGVGFILGPAIGGLLGDLDPRAPFMAAAALAALNFIFGYLVLPESLSEDNRRPFQWLRANPIGGLLQIGNLPGVGGLLAVMFMYSVANFVYPAIWAYFTEAAFGWDNRIIGLSLATYGISMAIVQGGLIRVILPVLGEVRAVCWGLILNTGCLVAYGLAGQPWMIWCLIPISAVGALVAPAMQAVMANAAGDDQQGELQGVLASINSLAMVLSPILMTQAFFWATRDGGIDFPGTPFLVASVLMGLALAIFLSDQTTSRAADRV